MLVTEFFECYNIEYDIGNICVSYFYNFTITMRKLKKLC